MSTPESPKPMSTESYAELLKKAASHLAEVAQKLEAYGVQESLVTSDVQWIIDASHKELVDSIKNAQKIDELYDRATELDADESVQELLLGDS